MRRSIRVIFLLTLLESYSATAPPAMANIRFEITSFSKTAGRLHWKLTNHSGDGIYVYNFFLLGPAYNIERKPGKIIFDTSPIVRIASCPPDRVAPFLLLFVRSRGVIEGDFVDPEVRNAGSSEVSIKIAVGLEPDTVVEQAKRFYNSDCKHSPYDAVVDWATFIESDATQVF